MVIDTNIIPTGIDGLDVLLDGGIIKNRVILIQGSAGTGKSTLGMQFLINGINKFDENGLFVLMDYDKQDLIEDMNKFGWQLNKLIDESRLKIISPIEGLETSKPIDIDNLINLIHQESSSISAKRIVIDSLNSLEFSIQESNNLRKNILRFITLIRELNVSTFMLNEIYNNNYSDIYTYITHGVISLYNVKMGSNRFRAIEIMKMRGIKHSTLTHSLVINNEGISILPHEIDLSNSTQ